MKSIADRQKLYQEYISHYETRIHEGNVTLCDYKLECRGDTQLSDSPAAQGGFYSHLIRQNLESKKQEHRLQVLQQMMKGFAILELICVNLFLFPWRKEIRTLKKFTGNFVYFVEPVIPEEMTRQILQRVGYSMASETEYTITGQINTEEAKRTAFELYLSRIECEKLHWLMRIDKSECARPLVNGRSTISNRGIELPLDNAKVARAHEIDGINKLDLKNNTTGNDDTTKAADLTVTHMSSQDVFSDLSKKEPRYYIKHMDSDEFLTKYSDLNLAQQPIFPLNVKQKKAHEWTTQVYEEPNFTKPLITVSSEREAGSRLHEGKDNAAVTCGLQDDNIDVRIFTDNLESPKPLIPNENPAEVIVPAKQERVVTKLKMKNVPGESLGYPIEETLPPDSAKYYDTGDLMRREVKWAFLKTKDDTESFTSPMSLSSDFSMLNISNKSPTWPPGIDNRLREPPNSTYIPPVAPETECMRLTNIKPDENHFQTPALPEDNILVNDFNVHEDTKEDYVMISKTDHLHN